jgi:hypothetical protein
MPTSNVADFLGSIGLPVGDWLRGAAEPLLEAGRLAVLRPSERGSMVGAETAAIAWACAAAGHLGLDQCSKDPRIGVPLLDQYGMTTADLYPAMTQWLRDELDVRHLRAFWWRHEDVDWVTTNTLLSGLNLNLRETFNYILREKPSFAEFEAWILERNGGSVSPERIARLNWALYAAGISGEAADPLADPVLSDEDLALWDENGYVILHDAVPPENRHAAVEAICSFLNVDLSNPDTWYQGPQGHSIWIPLLHHPALNANRDSPRIHRAFAQLWGREDLWSTIDQAGLNPPERPGWKFPGPHLHWDVSLARPIPFGLQGILYLTDTAANQGAFTCVPGFQRRIDAWLDNLPMGEDPRKHDFSGEAIPIEGRAGDLVIWHHALPHGSSPNTADVPRIVQYVFQRPSHWDYNPVWI